MTTKETFVQLFFIIYGVFGIKERRPVPFVASTKLDCCIFHLVLEKSVGEI
jgi:hypothetical protein